MTAAGGSSRNTQPQIDATEALQSVLLEILLEHHPAQLSLDEVVREVVRDPNDAGERDEALNAVRDLVRAGLVHRSGQFVFAARAAVRSQELRI